MFASRASTQVLRNGVRRTAQMTRTQLSRGMGGGAKPMHVSEIHARWGEAFGVVAWLWVFHRARQDLPVMYGFRHPWEHAEDPFNPHPDHGHHGSKASDGTAEYEKFSAKAMRMNDDDDEEEEEDDDDEDDE